MKRKKVSDKIEADVIYNSNRKCCVCKELGVNLHHIDKNPANSTYENLAYLCYECHHNASVTNGLKKSLKPATIIRFRDEHYKDVSVSREKSRSISATTINKLTSEVLLDATLTAVSIIEIEKIKEAYFEQDWPERSEIIQKLYKFSNFSNYRISSEVLRFLEQIEGQTRAGMPASQATEIESLVSSFFPLSYQKKDNKKNVELGKQCANIGMGIAYDAFIWLKDLSVGVWGLMILKLVYRFAKIQNVRSLMALVQNNFDELIGTLNRPERNDLSNAIELVTIFQSDLERRLMDLPKMPQHLATLLLRPKTNSNFG